MIKHITTTPAKALEKLKAGNARYIDAKVNSEDISQAKRTDTLVNGQKPYAIIITCSDSRVIPENIFMTGIGELFVIRIAGNVIDEHQLGSIEYAASHLGAPLIVVMGHTHCGAVHAAINHEAAIGDECDPYKAACLNVKSCEAEIEASLEIQKVEHQEGLHVIGAMYHLENGVVDFI